MGAVRANIHKLGNGAAGLVHRQALEQLAHLVEEHNPHRLGVLTQHQSAQGGHAHEEVFVKNLAVGNVANGLPQHIPPHYKIGDEEDGQPPQPPRLGGEHRRNEQYARHEDAGQGLFMPSGHGCSHPHLTMRQ